ncbi:MAG: hypothetical protein AAFZ07_09415 [Actinomycetota bacterium]
MDLAAPPPTNVALIGAGALMHRVPDGLLTLGHDNGNQTVVSFGPNGQMTPCELRGLLGAGAATRFARGVATFELGGCFESLGGGVYARHAGVRREGWFVTALRPIATQTLLSGCELPVDEDEAVDVHLVGDSVLGVTVGSIRLGDVRCDPVVDEIAMRMNAACAAEEVVAALCGAPTSGDAA